MSDVSNPESICARVAEQMADILDGTAPAELFDHLADCDACRDARYDAEQHRALVAASGADYVAPADFEARVLAALDRRGEAAPEPEKPAAEPTPVTAPLPVPEAQVEPKPEAAPATTSEARKAEPVIDRPGVVALPKRNLRRLALGGAGAALATAAAAAVVIGIAMHKNANGRGGVASGEGWHGNVAKLSGAGLSVCAADGRSCTPVAENGAVPSGSVLVTDPHTQARIRFSDGTELSLDGNTRIALGAEKSRRAKLEGGSIVIDVAHIEGQNARIDVPTGHIEVLGTKFSVIALPDSASVDVSRGVVKLADEQGRQVEVRAGEQGRSYKGIAPFVGAAPSLGESMAWSESAIAEGQQEEVAVRGLGELKAKKPGDSTEKDGAVSLTSHAVKVRIAGAMARTEVDEVFTNNTDEVLEGIYRFPVPPDAKIERLALEVDGKLEEGAFVDRDRAAAIWRGAIVNAAPQMRHQVQEEIVWVPGPWRDPALLEWQRGGRFELRIYPIPKRGARRVILAYTQNISPTGGVRRYNYPLPHDPSGTTKVGRFDVDIQVRGHDAAFGVRSRGYELAKAKSGDADQLTMSAVAFQPAGDLTVEYALPDRDAELAAWAYKPSGDEAKKLAQKAEPKPLAADKTAARTAEPASFVPKTPDDAPYVALALRPKLPRSREDVRRTFVIVVDSSRSMFGESYKRATNVAAKLVRELEPSDSYTLLACDTDCRVMPGGLQPPGAQAALESRRFLESVVPEGASDPTAAIRAARTTAQNAKELRIVYIGDGMPTSGAIRPAYVTHAIEEALPPGTGTLTTVAIGSDSDIDTLAAMARGGGGVMLPFVPGQTTAEAVYATLGATYGTTLRDVTVELPAGLSEVAPKRVDTIIAGGEQVLVARMDKSTVEGTVVVRGNLGKERFEQRYPVRIEATEAKGNAFVPRLYAATRIADLERETGPDAKKEAIRLSSVFDVASRFTSLLVLESEAMFKAFGLDNTRTSHLWTGEEAASGMVARGANQLGDAEDDAMGGKGLAEPARDEAEATDAYEGAASGPTGASGARPGALGAAKPAPAKPMAKAPPASTPALEEAKKKTDSLTMADEVDRASRRAPSRRPSWSGGPMIPMRRIWERKGSVLEGQLTPKLATLGNIASAEREVAANGNRREAVKKLFTLYAIAGDIERARSVAEKWSEKEPLDPEALTARADIAARSGDRDSAIRILGSVVDVRPDDVASQKRLARLHRWAGRPVVGCRHSLAIAQLRSSDASLLAEAVSCGRKHGEGRLADEMFAAADERVRKAAESMLSKFDDPKDELSGDLRVEATWLGGSADVDIALIDPDGNRISWLGAPTKSVISARDVTSTSRESLALRGGKPGEYVIEVVRSVGNDPVRGELTVNVAGARRVIPFNLSGPHATVGIAKISMESRLVPVPGVWGSGGWR